MSLPEWGLSLPGQKLKMEYILHASTKSEARAAWKKRTGYRIPPHTVIRLRSHG
jgi:hypothetical protein